MSISIPRNDSSIVVVLKIVAKKHGTFLKGDKNIRTETIYVMSDVLIR